MLCVCNKHAVFDVQEENTRCEAFWPLGARATCGVSRLNAKLLALSQQTTKMDANGNDFDVLLRFERLPEHCDPI